jgi:hypothetical protein
VLEDEEQQNQEPANKISTFEVGKDGKKRPMLNSVGSKPPAVSKPNQPIVIDETNEEDMERPQTAKSQATNAGKLDDYDDDLFGNFDGSKKKYVG